jgi:alpha-aminoadipic semialdehyde synthase
MLVTPSGILVHRSLSFSLSLTTFPSQIESAGFAPGLTPMVFGFTGNGNVSKGAQEIFQLLPHEFITPEELPLLAEMIQTGKKRANKIYGVVFSQEHLVKSKDGTPYTDRTHYYAHPELYEARFHSDYLPYLTFLSNGMYWDFHFPRLITKQQIKELRKTNKNLKFIADISCDVGGSIEFLSKCTDIDHPFYYYLPESDTDKDSLTNEGIGINSVEILPTELPRDASEHFGRALMPLLPPLLRSSGSMSQTDMEDLPAELRRACITSHGELMPKWKYISRLRAQKSVLSQAEAVVANIFISVRSLASSPHRHLLSSLLFTGSSL